MENELKQFGDLSREDFERHPLWIGCHSVDYDQPWYDDTDEETFRPWTGDLPADGSESMLLVRSTIELRDGSTHLGFVTTHLSQATSALNNPTYSLAVTELLDSGVE